MGQGVRRAIQWSVAALVLGGVGPLALTGCVATPSSMAEESAAAEIVPAEPPAPPVYERLELPTATVHLVTIPDPAAYPVSVAAADALTLVPEFEITPNCTVADCAVAAINAGFFDPNNGLTTSHIVDGGAVAGDPQKNERLVGNPDLAPYMDQILDRSELRRYDCGGTPRYAIAPHSEPIPTNCALVDAVGAGPQLLPQDTSELEGFVDATVTPRRDALGSQSANARSAIGLRADGAMMLVMVAQVPGVTPSGMGFAELAEFMAQRGVTQALNLDGGSSATLVYEGTPHYGRLNQAGETIQRPVKSILWVGQPQTDSVNP